MILLYRSPNRTIDGAEWHVTVVQTGPANRPIRRFLFRRTPGKGLWQPIHMYGRKLPEALHKTMHTYSQSIKTAIASARVAPRAAA